MRSCSGSHYLGSFGTIPAVTYFQKAISSFRARPRSGPSGVGRH